MKTLKLSAKELVTHWYGDRPIGQDAIHDAVAEMMRRGWLASFIPQHFEWERMMVFVPNSDPYAGIVRYLDGRGVGVIPRGMIESRTQQPLSSLGTGLFLSCIGIAIERLDGNNVFIRGTTPRLALMANQVRIHPLEQLFTRFLIGMVVGKDIAPNRWNQDLRLRVALAFDDLNIDVPGVLDGDERSDVQSRWLFPPPPPPPQPPPPEPPRTPFDPSLPAAPDPTPIDPNIPPF